VKQTFRPEFLNRIDEVMVFHALTQEQMAKIVDLLLRRVEARLVDQGVKLVVSEEAKAILAHEGYDKMLGARPLRRAIQRLIEDPLSEALLYGKFQEGDTVEAVVQEGGITFRPGGAAAAVAGAVAGGEAPEAPG
jgi:ATP-dependent Clp protease ATP-binding subunit ClpC